MKIALIHQNTSQPDFKKISARVLINGPGELKIVGEPLYVFDTIELTPEEDTLIRRIFSSGPSDSRELLDGLLSRVASSAYWKGNVAGHYEVVVDDGR